jgi:uncharacterized Zn finger protein
VELLAGRLSNNVIATITAPGEGLFPKPGEIQMSCSCPDWAGMCKHVAAVMYGIGARLDHQPELLFLLRKVDQLELIDVAVSGAGKTTATTKKTLAASDVADVFGIEIAEPADTEAPPAKKPTKARPSKTPKARPTVKAKKPAVKAAAPAPKLARKPRRSPPKKKSK